MSAVYTEAQIKALTRDFVVNRKSRWDISSVEFSVTNKRTGTFSEAVIVPFDRASSDLHVSLVVGDLIDQVVTLDGVFKKMEEVK